MRNYGHQSCNFIPACTSTYVVDHTWVGDTFCLAPTHTDFEIRDDIYNIEQYYNILKKYCPEFGRREITITVNLVLSTNYLANFRTVCAGDIKVEIDQVGLEQAYQRLQDVRNTRFDSKFALNPERKTKKLSMGADEANSSFGFGGDANTYSVGSNMALDDLHQHEDTLEPSTAIRAKSMAQFGALRYAEDEPEPDRAPPPQITSQGVNAVMGFFGGGDDGPAPAGQPPPPPPPPSSAAKGMFGGSGPPPRPA